MADSPLKQTPLHSWIADKIGSSSGAFTREAITAYQLRKVRETLSLARENSIFYRSKLNSFPPDIASLEELKHCPFTTAEDIRREPLQFLCVSQNEIQRVVTLGSSGTTGPPKRIFFTRDDQELTIDFFRVGMSTFTAPGDRVLILLPVERPGSVGDLLAIALERMGASGIRHGLVRDVGHTLAVMANEGVNGVVGVPTQVLGLVRKAGNGGIQPVSVEKRAIDHGSCTASHCPRGGGFVGLYGLQPLWHDRNGSGRGGGVSGPARIPPP